MKYKVMYTVDNAGGGSPDVMTTSSFYTFNQAHLSAQAWNAISGSRQAFLWDGITWRVYA